jgi:uncharacterized protein (TIGR02231 family)
MSEVEAPIVAVTVYTDRAQITRRGRIALQEAGVQELIVGGLPAGLDPNSLRAAGRGSIPVTIIGVESKERHLTETPYQGARELQEQLQALQDEDKALEHKDETLSKRLDVIQMLADNSARRYASTLAAGDTPLEAAGQMLDFVSEQMAQAQAERGVVERERRENARKQQALQSQISQLQGAKSRRDHYVKVTVEAQGVGEFELELLYVVPGAGWVPLYDARLALQAVQQTAAPAPNDSSVPNANAPEATLTLSYLASLHQNTGEDWTDVALTLSTARPSMGSLPPKLEPMYISVAYPAPPAMLGAAPMPASMAQRSMSRQVAKEADDDDSVLFDMMAIPEQAVVETSGATVTFGLPHSMSVPADGQPHRATIAINEFPCRLDYRAVPRRAELGYLRATIVNKSNLVLLPGEANIFRDGVFVGSSQIESVAPGQEFKLFLGPDDQVRTRRELTRRDVDKNLIGNVRRHTYAYSITLENLKSHRVPLSVLDQVPVSRHEQIKVKLRHAEPAPATNDLGELRWDLTLAPGSKRDLTYEYTVESPRDLMVSGLSE